MAFVGIIVFWYIAGFKCLRQKPGWAFAEYGPYKIMFGWVELFPDGFKGCLCYISDDNAAAKSFEYIAVGVYMYAFCG